MIKKFYFILMFGLLVAGTDGTIRGKIIAANDGQPLAGVQVFIASEQIGSVSDIDGNFLILNVPIDDHELTVNLLGYKIIKANVTVSLDRTTWYNVALEVSALEGETVYISGEEALVEKGRTAKKVTVEIKTQTLKKPIIEAKVKGNTITDFEQQHVINLLKLLVKENINIENISYKRNKLNNIVATYLKENTIKNTNKVINGVLKILEKKK